MSMIVNRSLNGSLPANVARTVSQSAIPVALVSDGIVAADGTLTLNSPVPNLYGTGCWVRLPAGAIVSGASGLYWAIFSSTTVAVVYTTFADPALPFTPYVPSGVTRAVGSGVAYTQTTGVAVTVANIVIPGGAMGPNGAYCVTSLGSRGGSAGNVNRGFFYNGSTMASYGQVSAGNLQWAEKKTVYNRATAMQVYGYYVNDGTNSTNAPWYSYANTALDSTVTYVLGLVNGADCAVLEAIRVELFPG